MTQQSADLQRRTCAISTEFHDSMFGIGGKNSGGLFFFFFPFLTSCLVCVCCFLFFLMCNNENHGPHERDAQLLTSFQTSKRQKLLFFFFALAQPSPTPPPPAGSSLFVWADKLLSPSFYMSGIIKENSGSDDEPEGLLRGYRLVEFATPAEWRKQAGSFFNENFAIQRDTQFCAAIPTVPRQRRRK